jgi:hypothetical protein
MNRVIVPNRWEDMVPLHTPMSVSVFVQSLSDSCLQCTMQGGVFLIGSQARKERMLGH